MSRPDFNRDESYNRIRLNADLKSRICSQITDSSESLPLSSVSEDPVPDKPSAPFLETPVPERSNPLEQANTSARKHAAEPTPDDSTLSLPSTAADGEGAGSVKGRPKMPGRPSTMKRIGTAIKKTISHNKQ